jgi:methyl-accepting chemotaxis protein
VHFVPTRAAALTLVLAAVVLTAGCGSKKQPDTTTEWANSLCTAVTTWKTSVTQAAEPLKNGSLSKSSIQTAGNELQTATNTFVSSVKALGKPNTAAGTQAQQSVDQLSTEIQDGTQKISDAAKGVSGVSDALGAISTATATLSTMATEISTTFTTLQGLDAKGELKTAFNQADACKSLRASTST